MRDETEGMVVGIPLVRDGGAGAGRDGRGRVLLEWVLEDAGEELDEEGGSDCCHAGTGDGTLLIERLVFHGLYW